MATGLPEVKRRQTISIPGIVDVPEMDASAWGELGRIAGDFADQQFEKARRGKVREFAEAGEKAVTRGPEGDLQVELLPGNDKLQQAYNRSAESAYLARAETDIRSKARELQRKNFDQPDSFQSEMRGYVSGVVQNAPGELAPQLEMVGERELSAGYHSLANSAMRRDRQQNLDALETKAETVIQDATALAREGRDGVQSTEFSRLSNEYQAVLNAQVASGYINETQRDQMVEQFDARMNQSAVTGQLVKAYENQGETAALQDMRSLRESGVKGLNGDQVETAIQHAQSTIRQRRREQSAARAQLKDRIDDHLASIQTTGQGISGINDQAQQLLGPEELQEFVGRQERARRVHGAVEVMRQGTPGEINETLAQFRPEPGTEGYAERLETFRQMRDRAQGILDQRSEDAAAYARSLPDVEQKYQQAARNQATLEEAISYNLETQRELGIPRGQRRAVAKEEAQSLVREIEAAPTDQRGAIISRLQDDYGRHWDRVFGDLVDAGMDPQNQVLASTVGQPALAQRVAQVIETGSQELKKGIDNADVRAIEDGVDQEMADFREVFEAGDYTGGATTQMNALTRTVKDVALAMYRQGEADTASAATKAAQQLVTSKFHILNGDDIRAHVPKQIGGQRVDTGKLSDVAEMRQSREMIESFDPQPIGSGFETPDGLNRERTIRTAVNSGYWVTNETNDGLVLMVPFRDGGALPLTNADGERYEIDLRKLPQSEEQPATVTQGMQRPGMEQR